MNQQEQDMKGEEIELCVDPDCLRIFRHKKHGYAKGGNPAVTWSKA